MISFAGAGMAGMLVGAMLLPALACSCQGKEMMLRAPNFRWSRQPRPFYFGGHVRFAAPSPCQRSVSGGCAQLRVGRQYELLREA